MSGLATTLGLPSENLLQPDLVRRLAWNPPAESSAERTAAELSAAGARPWQVELTAHPLAEALAEPDTPAAAG
jgi:ribonuclease D